MCPQDRSGTFVGGGREEKKNIFSFEKEDLEFSYSHGERCQKFM